MEPVVLIGCEVCGKGCKEGESATYDHDGEECLIQSRTGGFICKDCWKKFEQFVTSVTLCGADECEHPEEPEKVK